MASIVYINTGVPAGNQAYSALQRIRNGIGTLEELDGLRAEAIGAGAGTMASVFGTGDSTQGQALSDRWVAFLAAYNDNGNTEMQKLRDLIDALTAS